MGMKALSIRQPWAWAVINAGKDIENRNWLTRLRGRFWVHAAKGVTRWEYEDAAETIEQVSGLVPPPLKDIERGGLIGSVDLVNCVTDSPSPWFGGRFGFVLIDPMPMEFFPLSGTLGFFDIVIGAEDSRYTARLREAQERIKIYNRDMLGQAGT